MAKIILPKEAAERRIRGIQNNAQTQYLGKGGLSYLSIFTGITNSEQQIVFESCGIGVMTTHQTDEAKEVNLNLVIATEDLQDGINVTCPSAIPFFTYKVSLRELEGAVKKYCEIAQELIRLRLGGWCLADWGDYALLLNPATCSRQYSLIGRQRPPRNKKGVTLKISHTANKKAIFKLLRKLQNVDSNPLCGVETNPDSPSDPAAEKEKRWEQYNQTVEAVCNSQRENLIIKQIIQIAPDLDSQGTLAAMDRVEEALASSGPGHQDIVATVSRIVAQTATVF